MCLLLSLYSSDVSLIQATSVKIYEVNEAAVKKSNDNQNYINPIKGIKHKSHQLKTYQYLKVQNAKVLVHFQKIAIYVGSETFACFYPLKD